MSAKHTPGPWNKIGHSIGVDAGEIATVWSEVGNQEHNARLIAAAPELLFCLQVILEHTADEYDKYAATLHLAEVKKAVAKALGE
jgi:hypothetical protein